MPLTFDHLVLASRDLTAQAQIYASLGFQVGSRNQHPWGTQNHIIQLDGTFLELIGVAPGATMTSVHPAPRQFSFGGFIGAYLAHTQGMAMLALNTRDARSDAARFNAMGIGDFEPFHFSRSAQRADGSLREVAFTLAFAESALIEQAAFFTCQHHNPENFWATNAQIHPNSARKLNGVVMVAENPADHAEFLAHFTGQHHMLSTSMGLEIDLAGGKIEVLTPLAAQFRYGSAVAVAPDAKPHFCAFRVGVASMEQALACLQASAITALELGGRLMVPAKTALGVAVAFEPLA